MCIFPLLNMISSLDKYGMILILRDFHFHLPILHQQQQHLLQDLCSPLIHDPPIPSMLGAFVNLLRYFAEAKSFSREV